VRNIYRSVVVIAVEVRSTAGAAGATPTTGAVAGGWTRTGTNASSLPPTFPDAGPVNECRHDQHCLNERRRAPSKMVPETTSRNPTI
jgi:hypothetical protein